MRAPSPMSWFCRRRSKWQRRRLRNTESKGQPHRPSGPRISRRQDDALRRLRPQRHLRAHHRRDLRDGRPAGARDEAVRHRLLVKEPGLLHDAFAQLQQRARTHAIGRDRRAAGQQDDDGARRLRRRRHGLDRHGTVRSPDAPQSAADLHHRRQRRVRPDQGPVLGDRRYRLEAEDRASSTICRPSTPAPWPFSWARPSSAARSPATRSSCWPC